MWLGGGIISKGQNVHILYGYSDSWKQDHHAIQKSGALITQWQSAIYQDNRDLNCTTQKAQNLTTYTVIMLPSNYWLPLTVRIRNMSELNFKLFVPCTFSTNRMKTNWCHYFIRILPDLYTQSTRTERHRNWTNGCVNSCTNSPEDGPVGPKHVEIQQYTNKIVTSVGFHSICRSYFNVNFNIVFKTITCASVGE